MIKINLLGCICLLTVFFSCSPSVVVNSDYDSDASFDNYKTFNVIPKKGNDSNPIIGSQINQKRIMQALISEMKKRGYSLTEQNPDLLISFTTDTQQKQEVDNNNNLYGPWFWRNSGSYMRSYEQGRLVVNINDTENNQLLWQGWAVGEIKQLRKKNKREEYIQQVVAKVMKEYERRVAGMSFHKE